MIRTILTITIITVVLSISLTMNTANAYPQAGTCYYFERSDTTETNNYQLCFVYNAQTNYKIDENGNKHYYILTNLSNEPAIKLTNEHIQPPPKEETEPIKETQKEPTKTKPDRPTNLMITSKTTTDVFLVWEIPSNDGNSKIIEYKIEYKERGGQWKSVNSNNNFKNISGLKSGTTHEFKVSAVNSIGTSQPSRTITGMTETEPIKETPTRNEPPKINTKSSIKIDTCGTAEFFNTPKVTGRYTSDGNYVLVSLNFVVLGSNGEVLDATLGSVRNISPGETKSFSIISPYTGSFSSCSVEIAGKFEP